MTIVPLALASKSSQTRFGFEGAARLVNAYAEATGQESKNGFAVYATEGLDTWITPALGKTYVMLATETVLYGVTGVTVWAYDINDVLTIVGTLPIEGPCYMARNRRTDTHIGLVTAADQKYYVITGTSMVNVTTGLIGPPTSLDVRDGHFAMSMDNENRYQNTNEDDGLTLNILNFGVAKKSPDPIWRVISGETEISFMGPQSIEWHVNQPTVGITNPFTFVTHIALGLIGAEAATRLDRDIYWGASDGTVRKMEGYGGTIISNPSVERAIGSVIDKSTIRSFGWNARSIGHSFIAFTSPNWTWIYDIREGTWHERESYGLPFWRISAVVEWQGRVIAGDYETGQLYDMRGDLFDEAGRPLVMTCDTPPVDAFPYPVIMHALTLDVVPGVGRPTPSQPQNQDPEVMISYSDDGGQTFSAERHEKIGQGGNTNARVKVLRLGMMRRNGRTFRFRCSAAVIRCFQSAALDVEKLKG